MDQAAHNPRRQLEATKSARRRRPDIWQTYVLASVALTAVASWYLVRLNANTPGGLKVFGSFWVSGWAASHHQNPYAVYPLTWSFKLTGLPRIVDVNLSPPAMLPLFQAIALLSPNTAAAMWAPLSLVVFLATSALLVYEYRAHIQRRQIVWLLCGFIALHSLAIGEDYFLFFALAAGAWIFLEHDRQVVAGVLIGLLVAGKPNYLLWPLLLAIGGRWRSSAIAITVAATLSAIPLIVYGPDVYREWIFAIANNPHWSLGTDVSMTGIARMLGVPVVGPIASGVLVLAAFLVVIWKRPSVRDTSGIALTVGTLAPPLAWVDYLLLMVGPLFCEKWGPVLTLAFALLLVPNWHVTGFLPMCCITGYFFTNALDTRGRSPAVSSTSAQPFAEDDGELTTIS